MSGCEASRFKTYRSRGSLDGSHPVEDVIPVRERADPRVRFGLCAREGVGGTKVGQFPAGLRRAKT